MNNLTTVFFAMISMSAIAQSDTLLYEADSVKAIGQFRDGLKVGEWKWFSWNGKIQSSGGYWNDVPIGTWTNWHNDGATMAIVTYDSSGVKHGKEIIYNYSVPETIELTYQHGILHGSAIWRHLDGYRIIEGHYKENEKTGPWKWYWPNGNIQAEGVMRGNEREGLWIYYHENGSKENFGMFENGLKGGAWTFFNPNGKIRMEGGFVKDIRQGKWVHYDENGAEQRAQHFIDGEEKMTKPSP